MPKKDMSPEERKAFGEKMKAAREAKKLADVAKETPTPESNADIGELLKQIEEMKTNQALMQAALLNQNFLNTPQNANTQGSQITSKGIIGTFEKYITDPKQYPDPRERLYEYFESNNKLRRIGLRNNYEMTWEVTPMRPYERKDGVMETQPRFHLELNYIIIDPDTYEPTKGRYTVKDIIFFEDPQTALIVARDNGLEVDEVNEKAFLDEMRFIRVRDWLEDAFFPEQIQSSKPKKKDMVINGKQVQYFEVSSENPQTIPFNQLTTKIK